jgi:hypothetical protein
MALQGEETVYDAFIELGKLCLFNGGLGEVNGVEISSVWSLRQSPVMIEISFGSDLNALG